LAVDLLFLDEVEQSVLFLFKSHHLTAVVEAFIFFQELLHILLQRATLLFKLLCDNCLLFCPLFGIIEILLLQGHLPSAVHRLRVENIPSTQVTLTKRHLMRWVQLDDSLLAEGLVALEEGQSFGLEFDFIRELSDKSRTVWLRVLVRSQ